MNDKQLEAIHRDIRRLLDREQPQTWVSGSWVRKVTGWDGNERARARREGLVKHRPKKSGGVEYLLESIPMVFIISKQQTSGTN